LRELPADLLPEVRPRTHLGHPAPRLETLTDSGLSRGGPGRQAELWLFLPLQPVVLAVVQVTRPLCMP
jgi:hypothetical protein